jgi:hypothetical protein
VITFHPHHLIHRQLHRSSLPAVPNKQRREERLPRRIPTIHRRKSRSGLRKRRKRRKLWRRTNWLRLRLRLKLNLNSLTLQQPNAAVRFPRAVAGPKETGLIHHCQSILFQGKPVNESNLIEKSIEPDP